MMMIPLTTTPRFKSLTHQPQQRLGNASEPQPPTPPEPKKEWLLFVDEMPTSTSPFFRPTADHFSANKGLETQFKLVKEAIALSNLFSSDLSKTILNAWRQGLVSVARRLDYGWRSESQILVQYIQECSRRIARSQISPLVNAELFPKGNGTQLTLKDRALYPHLSDRQFKDLMTFDQQHVLDVEQLGGLYTALTDSSTGLRYNRIASVLSHFKCELETKDPTTGKGTGKYVTYQFRPNSALATHLKWKLAAEDTLKEQVDYFDLLHGANQHVPFLPYQREDEHSVRIVGEMVLDANKHLQRVGSFGKLPTIYQFLLQAKRGDFATITDTKHPENTTLNLPLAFKVFSGDLQNEGLDEIPMILGGEGSSLNKLNQLPLKTWLASLLYSCQPENPEQLSNGTFGKPPDVAVVWKTLWRDLKQGIYDDSLTAYTQRVGRAVEKIMSGKILLKGQGEIETKMIYAFTPDAENKLGLQHINHTTFVKETAAALWQLQTIVKTCNQLVNNQGEFKNLSPQAFQEKAGQLLEAYYQASFALAATLPGQNGKELASLKNLTNPAVLQGVENNVAEPLGAYKLLQLLCESHHLRKNRLPSLVHAAAIPELIGTVVTSLVATGLVWNYLDNNVIQPYENDAVEKKGSVKYTGLVMAAGFIPAMAAFIGMMKMDFFKKITGNKPHLHLGLVGGLGLMLQSVITVGLVRAFIDSKPNVKKPPKPNLAGTFTTKAQLVLSNISTLYKAPTLYVKQRLEQYLDINQKVS
jgi:hypothetical protein